MQPATVPETDPAAGVTPPIRSTAPWRVRTVKALPHMRLQVSFVDGTVGEVDLSHFLADPKVKGTVFQSLRQRAQFDRVEVLLGAIRWPNGADLAPDAMYDAIRECGSWSPE